MGKGRKDKVTYTYRTEEEVQQVSALEDFLFGGAAAKKLLAQPDGEDAGAASIADLVRQAATAASDDEQGLGTGSDDDDGLLFVEDRLGAAAAAAAESEEEEGGQGGGDQEAGPGPGSLALQQHAENKGTKRQRAPAWTDASDATLSVPVAAAARLRKLRSVKQQTHLDGDAYAAALRRQHDVLHPRTAWAKLKKQQQQAAGGGGRGGGAPAAGGDYVIDDVSEPDESAAQALLLSGSGLLLQGGGGGGLLAPGSIELSRLRDANCSGPSDAVVQALAWHPDGQLMLTAGFDKRLRLFQVDGLRNPLVQSLFLQDCPIHTAAFAAGGSCVVAAGRRPFYYVADLHTGQLDRVVLPPCLNLAPSGAPPNTLHLGGSSTKKQRKQQQQPGKASGRQKPRPPGHGSKGGIGMKSCESFVASPAAPGGGGSGGMLAFLGDGGHIGLVSLASRSSVGSLKMNGSARAAAFSADGTCLVTAGGDGVLYTWDLRSQRCLHTQRDEGAVSCTSLALSPDGGYLATGDAMGCVNIYSRPAGLLAPLEVDLAAGPAAAAGGGGGLGGSTSPSPSPTPAGFGLGPAGGAPLRSLMNLTTSVDSLGFSHDSQLLLMGSRLKRESLRLVHLPSATVFANWPTSRSPLQYVHCAAFSPHSGFLGIGNAKGRVLLYRLHHYPSV